MPHRDLPAEELAATLQGVLDSLIEPYIHLEAIRDASGTIVDFEYVDANDAACAYNRSTREEMLGTRLLTLLPGHREAGVLDAYIRVVETGEPLSIDAFPYENEITGTQRRSDLRAVKTGDGVSVIWRDVTEEWEATAALARSEERFRLLAENSSDVVMHLRDDHIAWVSPSVERALGWSAENLEGRAMRELLHPLDRHALDGRPEADETERARVRLLAASGSYHWFDGHGGALVRPDGQVDGRMAAFRLIDAEVAAEQELDRRARLDQLTGLMNRTEILEQISASGHHARRTGQHTAVLFCDIDRFKSVNDTYGHAAGDQVLRVTAERVTSCVRRNDHVARIGGDELLVLLTGVHGLDDAAAIAEKVRATVAYPVPFGDTFINATMSIGVALAVPGEQVDPLIARADAAMFRAKQSGRDQVIAIPSPVSARRVLVVDDDPFLLEIAGEILSGLGVEDVRQAADGHEALAVIDNEITRPDVVLCDINMTGMDGIELLRHLADRSYRGSVVLMSGAGDELLASVADLGLVHGLSVLGTVRKPLAPDQLQGLLESSDPTQSTLPIEEVKGVRTGRLSADEVRDGIASGCVDIHLQPKVKVSDRSVVGAEALLRWRDPERGILSPHAIVPIAEANGMIDDLTIAVYRRAVEAVADWRRLGLDLRVAVNLSAENLVSLDLPDTLARIAAEADVPPNHLVLEITENRLMDRLSKSLEVIGRLRLKGFGLSIDDYGMGFSNLGKLKQLPITELKVDRSFVSGADSDSVLRVILGSSVALGHSLGLSVVAEGLETAEEWSLLESLGCDVAQGYYIARPMPASDFPAWMHRWDGIHQA